MCRALAMNIEQCMWLLHGTHHNCAHIESIQCLLLDLSIFDNFADHFCIFVINYWSRHRAFFFRLEHRWSSRRKKCVKYFASTNGKKREGISWTKDIVRDMTCALPSTGLVDHISSRHQGNLFLCHVTPRSETLQAFFQWIFRRYTQNHELRRDKNGSSPIGIETAVWFRLE